MRDGGRIAGAIEIVDAVLNRHQPVKDALRDWGKAHRFAGSGDRAWMSGLVMDALRHRANGGGARGGGAGGGKVGDTRGGAAGGSGDDKSDALPTPHELGHAEWAVCSSAHFFRDSLPPGAGVAGDVSKEAKCTADGGSAAPPSVPVPVLARSPSWRATVRVSVVVDYL